MSLVLLLLLAYYPMQLVISQSLTIIRSPVNQSVCAGDTVNFTCVVMFTSELPGRATWFTNKAGRDAGGEPDHSVTDDSNGRSAPANVTTVLTVTNVSISNNGADYICTQGLLTVSDTAFLTVFGPPGDISNVIIPPDTITACSFVVQWSRPSSDPLCGSVQYTITVTTGGVLIITDTTTLTHYYVTELNDNTVYNVVVTASNNAGSSSKAIMVMTNNNGLPSSPPQVAMVTPLSSTSFTVNWIVSDHNYDYTVTWTNLNTGVMDSYTVADNKNSYRVTGLSDKDNYNVRVTAVGVCGMMPSDPITVYDPPNQPQFEYCISYNDGNPTLQVTSHVTVDTPRMSLSLTFSASYQTSNSSNNNNQSANYSLLSNMQYNCTAEFAVDGILPNDTIESVNVTVSGPYGSTSSLRNMSQKANVILSLEMSDIREDSATLSFETPCFSSDLLTFVCDLKTNNMSVGVQNTTDKYNGSVMAYSYPNHTIQLFGLNSSTIYKCCVTAINDSNMEQVGEPVCHNFTTIASLHSKDDDDDVSQWFYGVAIVAALLIASILFCIIAMIWCKGRKSNRTFVLDTIDATSRKSGTVPVPSAMYDCPRSTDDDKRTVAETQVEESLRNDGTIKDDKIQFVSPNVQNGRDWYDRLASESDRTVISDDIGALATTEGELSSEMLCYQVNDTNELHGDTIDTASKETGAVVVQLGDNPTYDWPRGSGDDKRRTNAETQKEESIRNNRDTIDAASNEPVAMAVQLGDNPTYGWPRGPGDAETRTGVETQKEESIINELYYHIDEAPRGQLEQQPPLNAAISLPTTNEAALANSNAAKKPPGKINFYDPIHQHSSAIPHLNTSSGDKYALPASKTGRASKQSDKTTTDKQEIPPYAMPDKSKKTSNQNKLPHYAVSSKSKKAASQKTQHTDLDVNSPASDESKRLIGQMARNTDSEIPPLPASKMIPIEEGPNMYAKIA